VTGFPVVLKELETRSFNVPVSQREFFCPSRRHHPERRGPVCRGHGRASFPIEGRLQAQRLSARLEEESIVAVYASPMIRNYRKTARILAEPPSAGGTARGKGCGRFRNGTIWEEMTREEVRKAVSWRSREWEKDPLYTFPRLPGERAAWR